MLKKIKTIKKPWGKELLFALTDRYAGKILVLNKGHRLSLQYHEKKDESLLLYAGAIKLTVNQGGRLVEKRIAANTVFHFPPGAVHRMEALKNSVLIEVSTPELNDVIRVQDDYDREIKHG
ncbi:MAG: cupin [Elusimicrobiota bacterium]